MKYNRNEKILILELFFMSLSIGIWSNYRQLWLKDVAGFDVQGISKLFSVALICSAVISFIISLFSSKIRIKNVLLEATFLRSIAMIVLYFTSNNFVIKTCILLTIMCEVIFCISHYPLLSYINKSDEMFRRKSLIDYVAKDIGVIVCGILLGIKIGSSPLISYSDTLIFAFVTNTISGIILMFLRFKEKISHEDNALFKSFKNIFKDKVNITYMISIIFTNISYGIIFDLMMLILTDFVEFDVSIASIFIIVCNFLGSTFCSIFNKYGKKLSVKASLYIKFGIRALGYLVAFFTNNLDVFIISIVIGFITCRILEDKVSGTFLKRVNNSDQFLYGNVRYFITCIGEGIGTYLAGVFLGMSFRYLFLGAGLFTIVQIIILLIANKLNNKHV